MSSAGALAELVSRVPPDAWRLPALGVWTVRDLVGHASRALTTIETYIDKPALETHLEDALDYFLAVRASTSTAEEVARRGVEAGKALGADPSTYINQLVQRVVELVQARSDLATVSTNWGTMTLRGYLPTRTFELTVHSLDLAGAAGLTIPQELHGPITRACELAGALAGRHGKSTEILLALTGRSEYPLGCSVV